MLININSNSCLPFLELFSHSVRGMLQKIICTLIIFSKYYQGISSKNDTKIIIQKNSKNSLKIVETNLKTKKSITNLVETKLSPKSYYLKIYRSKLANEMVLNKFIDEGSQTRDDITRSWKSYYNYLDKNIKVSYDFSPMGMPGAIYGALIEKFNPNTFKLTLYQSTPYYYVTYFKYNSTIFDFYFKVYLVKYPF